MKPIAILVIMLALCIPAFAADVDGKWTGNLTMPTGDVPVQFTLKADGAKLTGTTLGIDGSEVAISDGKIEGNNLSFKVTLDFAGMPFVLAYKGTVSPTELKLAASNDLMPMPIEMVLKKAAAAAAPAPAAK